MCRRCQKRYDKLFHYSDELVSQEMKIVRWIRMMRVAEIALRRLLKDEEWEEVVEEAMYYRVKFDLDDDRPGLVRDV